jgi:hypothetical protein
MEERLRIAVTLLAATTLVCGVGALATALAEPGTATTTTINHDTVLFPGGDGSAKEGVQTDRYRPGNNHARLEPPDPCLRYRLPRLHARCVAQRRHDAHTVTALNPQPLPPGLKPPGPSNSPNIAHTIGSQTGGAGAGGGPH